MNFTRVLRETSDKIEYENGRIEYIDEFGRFHKEDGPAIITVAGHSIWYRHGRYHRLDGAAVVDSQGNPTNYWYINDLAISSKVYKQWLIDNGIAIQNLSEDDKEFIMLIWSTREKIKEIENAYSAND